MAEQTYSEYPLICFHRYKVCGDKQIVVKAAYGISDVSIDKEK
ncbi:MAG: hypothetical protein E6231_19825 [Bacillota bacterium]|nr:hypothetical protein [Tissierella carlieri]MDU5083517.1 hypothetical protein [Bacillota bacterium]